VGVGSHFHVLCSRTRFRRYREFRVPFSCFALPDSFSAVPRASGLIFMFCAPGLIFGEIKGDRSCFGWYLGRRVPFSCFALPDSFSAVPRASAPVFLFCAPEHVFGGAEGVGSRFHVLRSRTRFLRFCGRRLLILCFELLESFPMIPRASRPVFMLCALGLIFGRIEGDQTCFLWYRGHRVPFSCFTLPGSFSAA
jgi:hypothetical protein